MRAKLQLVVVALMLVAIALGFFIGRLQAQYSLRVDLQRLEQLSELERQQRAEAVYLQQLKLSMCKTPAEVYIATGTALNKFQAGETNEAIEWLEERTDSNIRIVAAMLCEQSPAERDPKYLRLVTRWRDYCAKYGYPNYESAPSPMTNYFSLLFTNQ